MNIPTENFQFQLATAEDTAALAGAIAPLLHAGHVILLEGPIGAGKSHFARSLIQARLAAEGRVEDVPSPTFTLVQVYELIDCDIWHADLYRLVGPDDAIELGLDEAFSDAICLIEWPDRLGSLRPDNALTLSLRPEVGGDGRLAEICAAGGHWDAVLSVLKRFTHG